MNKEEFEAKKQLLFELREKMKAVEKDVMDENKRNKSFEEIEEEIRRYYPILFDVGYHAGLKRIERRLDNELLQED